MSALDFSGRCVIVTGAGAGLGRSFALELACRGAGVVVNNPDHDGSDKAGRAAAEIAAAGHRAVANRDDVVTATGGEALVAAALEAWGRVDAVIHSAGILRDRTVAKLSAEELRTVLDVHLLGAFHLVQPAFRAMKAQRSGSIVLMTSAAGLFGNPGQSNYAAAKMGVVGLSSVVALEGAPHGIRSNVVSPFARTPRATAWLGELAGDLDPDRVTPLVVYLASERCPISHRIISAGGGHFARVFVGRGPGWTADRDSRPTAEDVAANMDAILEVEGAVAPDSAMEEFEILARKLRE